MAKPSGAGEQFALVSVRACFTALLNTEPCMFYDSTQREDQLVNWHDSMVE